MNVGDSVEYRGFRIIRAEDSHHGYPRYRTEPEIPRVGMREPRYASAGAARQGISRHLLLRARKLETA